MTGVDTQSRVQDSWPISARRHTWRRVLLVGTPSAWIVTALLHPAPEQHHQDLRRQRTLARRALRSLILTVLMGAVLWIAVRGRVGLAATLTRGAIPIYLVFFSAFDAVAGIATGIAVRHANGLAGAEEQGAASTAEHLLLNHIAGDASPLAAIATIALTTAVLGVAMTFRQAARASRSGSR